MTYSSHRGFTRDTAVNLKTHKYHNDALDYKDLDYERAVERDERLNMEMEALEAAKIAMVMKQRRRV